MHKRASTINIALYVKTIRVWLKYIFAYCLTLEYLILENSSNSWKSVMKIVKKEMSYFCFEKLYFLYFHEWVRNILIVKFKMSIKKSIVKSSKFHLKSRDLNGWKTWKLQSDVNFRLNSFIFNFKFILKKFVKKFKEWMCIFWTWQKICLVIVVINTI